MISGIFTPKQPSPRPRRLQPNFYNLQHPIPTAAAFAGPPTAAERVNSRVDVSFGLEQHYIRGEVKMRVRCGLALCVMLAVAYGRIMEDQKNLMRSLVRAAS